MITMMRGDTRPYTVLFLSESNGSCSDACCPINLSSSNTSIQIKFREKGEDVNIFSVYAKKLFGGETGLAMLEWPLFGTDVEPGRYELEINVNFGNSWITAQRFIPVRILDTFGDISYINDSENALYREGKLFLRNVDTNKVHMVSLIGEDPSSLSVAAELDSLSFDRINADYDDVETVYLRIIKGEIYLKSVDADIETWRKLTLTGNPVSTFTITDKVLHFSMSENYSSTDDIAVKVVDGKFYMKNLDTLVWHEVTLTGSSVSTLTIN